MPSEQNTTDAGSFAQGSSSTGERGEFGTGKILKLQWKSRGLSIRWIRRTKKRSPENVVKTRNIIHEIPENSTIVSCLQDFPEEGILLFPYVVLPQIPNVQGENCIGRVYSAQEGQESIFTISPVEIKGLSGPCEE
jgi:hypothetical protein